MNPSWQAVRRLNGKVIRQHRIVARRLPTLYDQSLAALRRHLRMVKPALVICVGQAAGLQFHLRHHAVIDGNEAISGFFALPLAD
jgi:pyroglutamyl-peptidase